MPELSKPAGRLLHMALNVFFVTILVRKKCDVVATRQDDIRRIKSHQFPVIKNSNLVECINRFELHKHVSPGNLYTSIQNLLGAQLQ